MIVILKMLNGRLQEHREMRHHEGSSTLRHVTKQAECVLFDCVVLYSHEDVETLEQVRLNKQGL